MPSVPVLQLAVAIFSHCLLASAIRDFDQKSFQVLQVDAQPRKDGSSQCTSASTLRALLLQLGIPEEKLKNQNPHEVDGITSDGCLVTGINFRGRELHGTLPQELGELQELQKLDLVETKVAGDLSTLKSATKLHALGLRDTAVAGNLESLEQATKLQVLDLRGTAVAGNLESLEKATQLHWLNLHGTAVAGNLESLEKATKLHRLYLSATDVAGNLKSLEQATQLQWLDLSGTAVAGNLKSLEQATQLQWLDLSGTAVGGNLESLENATKLQWLNLHGTAVADNLSVLLRFEGIEVVDLGRTQVHGSLSEAWRGGCPKLRSLTLSDAWQGWFQQSRVQRPSLFAEHAYSKIPPDPTSRSGQARGQKFQKESTYKSKGRICCWECAQADRGPVCIIASIC